MNIPTAPPRETLNHCKCCRVDDRHIVLLRQQQTQHSCATSCDRAPLQHRPPRQSSKPHHRHSRLPCGFPTRGLSSRLSQKRPAQNEAGQESSLNSALRQSATAQRSALVLPFFWILDVELDQVSDIRLVPVLLDQHSVVLWRGICRLLEVLRVGSLGGSVHFSIRNRFDEAGPFGALSPSCFSGRFACP